MNTDPIQDRAGYCYGKMILTFFYQNRIAHSTGPVYIPVE